MMNIATKLFCLAMLTMGISQTSLASGGSGGFYSNEPAPVVDHTYEAGKAIFRGRNQAYQPHKFCILDAETQKVVKIKRKFVKPFKRGSAQSLANHLYSCQAPDQRASSILSKNDLGFLLYYLNKRFSLKLS